MSHEVSRAVYRGFSCRPPTHSGRAEEPKAVRLPLVDRRFRDHEIREMFDSGYLPLFSVRGVPVRAHWSTPFGAVLFSRFQFAPGYWLGFLGIVVLHELGHAMLVKRRGLEPLSADLHAFGGQCRYQGHETPLDRSVIAWGGVLAQAGVLVVALLFVFSVGWPQDAFFRDLLYASVYTNLLLIGLNLLPIPPLDGYDAWRLFGYLRSDSARAARRKRAVATQAAAADALVRTSLDRARRDASGERESSTHS